MTSHPSVGLSRPPIRAPSRTTSQTQLPFSGKPSKHVLIDLTDVGRTVRDGEGPSKRRKTEDGARVAPDGLARFQYDGSDDRSWQASGSRQPPQHPDAQDQARFQSPTGTLPSTITDAVTTVAATKPPSLPPLPMRPGGLKAARPFRQHGFKGLSGLPSRDDVQVKPYVLEPPSFAPRFEQDSMSYIYIFQRLEDEY